MSTPAYPWFQLVAGEELEQGDILEGCPVYQPPEDLAGGESLSPVFDFEDRDVLLMTQSCDLVADREKMAEVVMCPVWQLSEYKEGLLATSKGAKRCAAATFPATICWQRVNCPTRNGKFGLSISASSFHCQSAMFADGPDWRGSVSACFRLIANT